jgi:hypothetical protein
MIYVIKFSESEDKVLDKKELKELAILWDGEVTKHGDILTEEYPEDHCDCSEHFPVHASWGEYKGDYSLVEPWVIPVPTHEQYIAAVLGGEAGETARKGLLNEQATWEMVEFIPAHKEYKEEWSHSRESSDGYRSAGRSTVLRYLDEIPDTWVWVSSTGMRQEMTTENQPQFKSKFSHEWYCQLVKDAYIEAYRQRKCAWEATNVVKIKRVGKPKTEKPADAKPAKHPLSKRTAGYPDLKKYFYSLYPELQEYEAYINLCMWPAGNAVFEYRKGGCHFEQLPEGVDKHIYKFDETKKVDAIVLPVQEALERAKSFKIYADSKAAEYLVREETKKAEQQKERDYEAYKKAQQAKKGLVKSFEKWLQTVA